MYVRNNHDTLALGSLVVLNETLFESSSSFANRPDDFVAVAVSSNANVANVGANAAVAAGSWPPGSAPEILSGFSFIVNSSVILHRPSISLITFVSSFS